MSSLLGGLSSAAEGLSCNLVTAGVHTGEDTPPEMTLAVTISPLSRRRDFGLVQKLHFLLRAVVKICMIL